MTTTVTETGDGAIHEMVENKGKAKEKGKTKQKKVKNWFEGKKNGVST